MKGGQGVLLSAGVCMKVPFNRVRISKPSNMETTDMIDLAGVSQHGWHDDL